MPYSDCDNTLSAKSQNQSQNHAAWGPTLERAAGPCLNLWRFFQVSWRHLTWGKQAFCSHSDTEWESEDQKPDCNGIHPLETTQRQFIKMWSTKQSTVGLHSEADAGTDRRGEVRHQVAALWHSLNIYSLTEYPRLFFCRNEMSRISYVWFNTPSHFYFH